MNVVTKLVIDIAAKIFKNAADKLQIGIIVALIVW